MISENIRINWIEEHDGYIAAWVENGEVIFSAFDTMMEDAYFTLVEMLCRVEEHEKNMVFCKRQLEEDR